MNLAESTVLNAIRYSMGKNCFANIILAGPVYAGKRSMAKLISRHLNFVTSESIVSIFSQEDYYKDFSVLQDTKFGVKNIDAEESFDVERYISDAKSFSCDEREYPRICVRRGVGNIDYIYCLQPKGKVNIFTGPHAIKLLQSGDVEIPKAISIYMDVDLKKCIQKRIKNGFMAPNEKLDEYIDFVISQYEQYILPQREMANIIINCH